MTDDEFSKRIKKADDDVRAYANERGTTIGSHADAVRIFYPHILAMRQAGASWEVIAPQLKAWSGRDVAPATIKQYVTDINVGRMKRELSSTARPTQPAAPAAQLPDNQKNSRTETRTNGSGVKNREGTDLGLSLSDGSPIPGGFTPQPDDKWKRKT